MTQKVGHLDLVADSPVEVAAWVDARCGIERRIGGYQAYGFARRGKIIGGFVFSGMQLNRGNIEMTCAGTGAFLNMEVLRFLAWNVFDLLGVAHCTSRHKASNDRASRALERFGFVLEGRQSKAWDGVEDALLYGLTRELADERLSRSET